MGTAQTASMFRDAQELPLTLSYESSGYTSCGTEGEEKSDPTRSVERARVEERCRMARELHDSTSQLLVSLQLRLAHLKHSLFRHSGDPIFDELEGTVSELHRQIRSVSALNQPLDFEAGDLPDALRDFTRRFARMTGLAITVDAECHLDNNDQDVASAIFRVVQEALANVYRHADARNVSIRLRESEGNLGLSVCDDGIGIPQEKLRSRQECGLGLINIRARAASLGGTAIVRRLCQGTEVGLNIPLQSGRGLTPSSLKNQALVA